MHPARRRLRTVSASRRHEPPLPRRPTGIPRMRAALLRRYLLQRLDRVHPSRPPGAVRLPFVGGATVVREMQQLRRRCGIAA